MWGIAVLCGNLKLETSSGMHAPLVGATLPAAGIAMRYPNSAGSQCWVHHRSACWTCMRICAALRTSFFFPGSAAGAAALKYQNDSECMSCEYRPIPRFLQLKVDPAPQHRRLCFIFFSTYDHPMKTFNQCQKSVSFGMASECQHQNIWFLFEKIAPAT